MSKLDSLAEVGRFLLRRKRYWLVPLITLLVLLGTLLVLSEASAVGPFIYTLF